MGKAFGEMGKTRKPVAQIQLATACFARLQGYGRYLQQQRADLDEYTFQAAGMNLLRVVAIAKLEAERTVFPYSPEA